MVEYNVATYLLSLHLTTNENNYCSLDWVNIVPLAEISLKLGDYVNENTSPTKLYNRKMSIKRELKSPVMFVDSRNALKVCLAAFVL